MPKSRLKIKYPSVISWTTSLFLAFPIPCTPENIHVIFFLHFSFHVKIKNDNLRIERIPIAVFRSYVYTVTYRRVLTIVPIDVLRKKYMKKRNSTERREWSVKKWTFTQILQTNYSCNTFAYKATTKLHSWVNVVWRWSILFASSTPFILALSCRCQCLFLLVNHFQFFSSHHVLSHIY